jgi:hypothetical protein
MTKLQNSNSINYSPQGKIADSRHVVHFYQEDFELISNLSAFISEGISNGENCIVVATASHIEELQKHFSPELQELINSNKHLLLLMDADKTLTTIMEKDRISTRLFDNNVRNQIKEVASTGMPLRIFGEMVAILWRNGHAQDVDRLEKLWNSLLEDYTVNLYCAYPMLYFDRSVHLSAYDSICRAHDKVTPNYASFGINPA